MFASLRKNWLSLVMAAAFASVATWVIAADPVQLKVGLQSNADGSAMATARGAKTGEYLFSQVHGKYFEDTQRGLTFSACDTGAGTAVVTSISTTASYVLYNPQGSGKKLAIQKVSLGYVSGTMGAGTIYFCGNPTSTQTAPSGGTLLVTRALDIGNGAAGVGIARVGATVVAPNIIRPWCSTFPKLATTANPIQRIYEDIDGEIVIEPGCTFQIQAVLGAAGTSPVLTFGVTWKEVTIV